MAKKITPTDLLNLFLKQQKDLSKQESAVVKRLINTYGTLYKKLLPRIKNIELLLKANPDITAAQLKRSQEYRELIDNIESEVSDFSTYTKVELNTANVAVAALVVSHLKDFFQLSGLKGSVLSTDAISLLTDKLAAGGKLAGRIDLWAPNASEKVGKAIIEGVKLGRNPVKIAQDIRKAFGVGLSDAIRTTRTVQLWAYREATRANYILNSNIVKGWIWLAALDDRTCTSCMAMHGTIHGLEESLDDHYNGRCAMLPLLDGVDYGIPDAEEWFNALADTQKIKQMGAGRYRAYSEGRFKFSQLSKVVDDPIYNTMRVETPLKELING